MNQMGIKARAAVAVGAMVLVVGAYGGAAAQDDESAAQWKIGYSNAGGVGNGFREEQVCTAKAEALASGQVAELTIIHRNTDAAGQLQDIRDLIAKDVDAIVFNPNDPEALNPALEEAQEAGILTISVDAYVTNPDTYNLYNNQVKYGELGAKWLFDHIGGEGDVYYMRGFAGHPADSDRHIGVLNVLEDYPGITLLPTEEGVHTQWDPATATQLANDYIAAGEYDNIDAIWSSGQGLQIVDAIKASGKDFVPIVDADLGGIRQPAARHRELPGPRGRRDDQHGRRRWRGRSARHQAPERRGRRDGPVGNPAEHGPARPGHRPEHDRRGSGDAGVVAGRGSRFELAARPPDRGLDHVRPRAGRRLQGPGRVSRPVPDHAGDAGSPASPAVLHRA